MKCAKMVVTEISPLPINDTQINASDTPVAPIETPLAIYVYKYFEGLKVKEIK